MRRWNLLQPIGYQGDPREFSKARTVAVAEPPIRCNQVAQLDFSGYETTTGGIWQLAGISDSLACTGAEAIEAVKVAIAEPGGSAAHRCSAAARPRRHRRPGGITLVTSKGGALKEAAFAKFTASRHETAHLGARAPARTESASAPSGP